MALKLNKSDFKKLLKLTKEKGKVDPFIQKTVPRTNKDRLSDASDLLAKNEGHDTISFNADLTKCFIVFENVKLISMNDSLRLGARKMSKYKRHWHERVVVLTKKSMIKRLTM